MGTTLKDKKLRKYAAEELKVLSGVVDYADRMIYEEHKRAEYGPLRRHAYGKTVVIQTEKQGLQVFRLSSVSATYPNAASGYATPHSPVGRLCGYLRPGDEDETPRWGHYHVTEVRLFERFDGLQFESNVRNFLSMLVLAHKNTEKDKITNLALFLSQPKQEATTQEQPPPQQRTPLREVTGATAAIDRREDTQPLTPQITLSTFTIIEDDDSKLELASFESDHDNDTSGPEQAAEEYYGLNDTFFLNRTREQDEIMSRSPVGPMFVQGIAGSGKTSAALGRTKMLCDFNANVVVDETEFREIAGQSLEYWSGKYAGQFSQEGSVGFVRTGELVQYLRESCRKLELPHLPVQEYPELRSRLRLHRRVERHRPGSPKWAGGATARTEYTDTTMAWLQAADAAIAEVLASELPKLVPSTKALTNPFNTEVKPRAERIARIALQRLSEEIQKIVFELRSSKSGGFRLNGLAVRVQACIDQVREETLSMDTTWIHIGNTSWVHRNEHKLAEELIRARVTLYLRNSARLVFVDEQGVLDKSLTLLNRSGQIQSWNNDTRNLLEQGKLLVRDALGRTLPAKMSNTLDLYLRLLPEAIEKPYVLSENALRPLKVARGLGKERLELLPTSFSIELHEENSTSDTSVDEETADSTQKWRSVDGQFKKVVRQSLMLPLTHLADAYADALTSTPLSFPDPHLAQQISAQLAHRKLNDADIDLLLCLAHLVGRGFTAAPRELSEPDFYQAVFVDEVQDFTEQQVFLMAEQARPEYRAVTVVGDIAQKLHNGSTINLEACFPAQALPVVQLSENLRQLEAPGLAWFSTCFRTQLQEGKPARKPEGIIARHLQEFADLVRGPELRYVEDESELIDQMIEILSETVPQHTVAVLLPDGGTADAFYKLCKNRLLEKMIDSELSERIDLSRRHVRHFTAVGNAKGLEFDVVVLPYLECYDLTNKADTNRLYVALTRPRRKLILMSDVSRSESKFDDVWSHYENTVAEILTVQ